MDEVLYGVFAENVGCYLDGVDRLAQAAAQSEQARRSLVVEVHRLVAAWRALLQAHRPTGGRRCAGCEPRSGVLRRRSAAMCDTWRVATVYFVRR